MTLSAELEEIMAMPMRCDCKLFLQSDGTEVMHNSSYPVHYIMDMDVRRAITAGHTVMVSETRHAPPRCYAVYTPLPDHPYNRR